MFLVQEQEMESRNDNLKKYKIYFIFRSLIKQLSIILHVIPYLNVIKRFCSQR